MRSAWQMPIPNVCQVLEGKKFRSLAAVEFVRYLDRPPSGQGGSLTLEFRVLPSGNRKTIRTLRDFGSGAAMVDGERLRYPDANVQRRARLR